MVDQVTEQEFTVAEIPARLEAGTPNFVGAIALAEAMDYLTELGREEIAAREAALTEYAENRLARIPGLRILGRPKCRAGALSFNLEGVHPYDAASVLDKLGVALRSGTHCAQPALAFFGERAALRLSPAFYNTPEEIDAAGDAIEKTMEMFRKWTNMT
jgi:cysteine desulfurase/selenocysteine lyase